MGDKLRARARMEAAGVPVVPGSDPAAASDEELSAEARRHRLPASRQGVGRRGGQGHVARAMRRRIFRALSRRPAGWPQRRSATTTVYLEKLFERPRHVEFQIFGDAPGHVVHLFERECSVQRRHQKIVEETPEPRARRPAAAEMGEAAVEAARAVHYVGAGTVEFLLDDEPATSISSR